MYSEEYLGGCVLPTTAPSTAQSLASTGDILVYNIGECIALTRIMIEISTLTSSSGNIVLNVYQRPTYGSTSGQVLIGTLNILTAAATGTIVYKNIESVKILPGQQLAFNVGTAATSAGAGFCMFKAFMVTEDPRNVTAMVAST